MILYSEVYNYFLNLGFRESKEAIISNKYGSLLSNKNVHIVLKFLDHSDIQSEYLINESINLKRHLYEKKYNVWNSYYIYILPNNEKIKDLILKVEKESKGIRKYVISNKKDLKRVSFLFREFTSDTLNWSIQIQEPEGGPNTLLFETIKKKNQLQQKMKKEEVENIVDLIIQEIGDINGFEKTNHL